MSSDDTQCDRLATRRKILVASGSATMLGLAGCLGDGDDETDEPGDDADGTTDGSEDGTDDENGSDDEQQEMVLLVEDVGESHDHDDDHDDDHDHDHDHDDGHDHHYDEDGLSEDEIDHACGHLSFDEPESLQSGADEDNAPVIDTTHEPYNVTVESGTGYVRFVSDNDHDQLYGFFTANGSVDVLTGELIYEEHDEGHCEPMDRYVIVDPDHGEVLLELSPEDGMI